jgi:Fe-S-cluster containining protein
MNVSITAAEAERLGQATGRVPAQLNRPVPHPLDHFRGFPCPFLADGECSVYAARPFACRHHLSFDASPYWCEPERSGVVELARVRLDGATQALLDVAESSRMGGFADIRDFFPEAPQA